MQLPSTPPFVLVCAICLFKNFAHLPRILRGHAMIQSDARLNWFAQGYTKRTNNKNFSSLMLHFENPKSFHTLKSNDLKTWHPAHSQSFHRAELSTNSARVCSSCVWLIKRAFYLMDFSSLWNIPAIPTLTHKGINIQLLLCTNAEIYGLMIFIRLVIHRNF